jgi:phosphoglycolate phosphatase
MKRTFKAVIFDLDGTLVDSYEPITASLNRARAAFGLAPKSLEEVRAEVGSGLDVLMSENLGPDRAEEGVRLFRSHYRKVFLQGTKLLPGVAPTIEALGAADVPMAITSNKPAYFSREIVDALGLGERFRAVLGPEMVERPKPDPEMVLKAASLLGAPLAEILYIGDMTIDIDTCRSAGIAVGVIPSGSDSLETLEKGSPDFLLARFEEVLELIAPRTS